ncbi:MAG: SPOR domain-containing protein [Gemmatimonadota bacterium]
MIRCGIDEAKTGSFARTFANRSAEAFARRGLFLLLALLLPAQLLRAQDDPRLGDAVRLAQDGQSDSARAAVARILAATPATDSLYPQVLYTAGLVSGSVDEMRRQYSRVAVEFGSSAWADHALLRLSMLDFAAGNAAAAAHDVDRIRSDYPSSPLIGQAAYWGARSYFELKQPVEACRWVNDGMSHAGDNVELQNQLNFFSGRCTPEALQLADTTRTDSSRAPKADSTARHAGPGFAVQVGAVKTQAAADKLVASLKSAGFPAHVMHEAKLLKVRVGHFADRTAAQAQAATIKSKVGGSPYVVPES